MKNPQQIIDEFRLKQIAELLRSATGNDRKELLEEKEVLLSKSK